MAHRLEMEFYCAAIAGNMALVDRILQQAQQEAQQEHDGTTTTAVEQLVTAQSFAGHSILHGACTMNKPGVVQEFLDRPMIGKLLLNARDHRQGRTPLQSAIASHNTHAAQLLLQQDGIDVSVRDGQGLTALHLATFYNSPPSIIRRLLQATPYELIVGSSSSSFVEEEEIGNALYSDIKTPLMFACDNGNINVVRMLLAMEQQQPQQAVVRMMSGQPSKRKASSSSSSSSSTIDRTWQCELCRIRSRRDVSKYRTVACLVADAGIQVVPRYPRNEHQHAVYKVQRDFGQHLKAMIENPSHRLRTAAARGDVRALQALLLQQQQQQCSSSSTALSFWLNKPSKRTGWTALHCACRYGHVAAVTILLQAGASPWISSNSDHEGHIDDNDFDDYILTEPRNALQLAVEYQHLNVVEEMMRHILLG